MDQDERRTGQRVAVATPVKVWTGRWIRRGELRDLSPAGCGLAMKRPPQRGQTVTLLLPTPGRLRPPTPVGARVVRSDVISGLIFTSIPRASRAVLREWIEAGDPPQRELDPERWSQQERRTSRRVYDERLAALASSQLPYLLVARDLSLEGLRVDPLDWADLGTRLEVSFPVPGREVPLGLPAIVWRHDGRRGTVLRFTDLEPRQRATLEGLLKLLPELPDDRRDVILLTEVA